VTAEPCEQDANKRRVCLRPEETSPPENLSQYSHFIDLDIDLEVNKPAFDDSIDYESQ
jgi:hypothetical protein